MNQTTILIVEDESIVAADLAGKLGQIGYALAGTAASGEEAIALARERRPDLVLMDIRLPGSLDGIQAAALIRRECDLPVIYLTSYSDKATLERAKVTDPFGYILKPFDDRDIQTRIEMALHKHRTDRQLRESEERFRQLADASFEGLVIHADGVLLDVNKRVTDMLGYDGEALTGKAFWDFIDAKFHDLVREHVRRGSSDVYEVDLIHADGHRVPVEVLGRPLTWQGRQVRSAALRDITKRKQAEESLRESEKKYRELFQNMTEEVHFWKLVRDENGRIKTWRVVDVNPPALKTWGRKSIEDTIGRTADEIYPGATEHYMPIVQKIMTEGVPYSYEDYFPPPVDKHFRFTSVPLGEYFITTGADITLHKRAAIDLQRSAADLQAANATLRESRVAALNLAKDAVEARQQAERAEAEIRRHVEELRVRNEELARFNRVAVDRELRMVELKKQVNDLCVKAGMPARYKVDFEQEGH